jgi:hypothetical protein
MDSSGPGAIGRTRVGILPRRLVPLFMQSRTRVVCTRNTQIIRINTIILAFMVAMSCLNSLTKLFRVETN